MPRNLGHDQASALFAENHPQMPPASATIANSRPTVSPNAVALRGGPTKKYKAPSAKKNESIEQLKACLIEIFIFSFERNERV
jgi:hypothetical protein